MKSIIRAFSVACLLMSAVGSVAGTPPGQTTFVITNEDAIFANNVSFFAAGGTVGSPTLSFDSRLSIGGEGIGGGFFGLSRVAMLADPSAQCVYASNAGTGDISGVVLATRQLAGQFSASPTDVGDASGIGLVVAPNYVYAAYTSSNTIATFSVLPGCQLSFVDDTPAAGLNGGSVAGMAIHGNMLVVAYGDGSIESFNVANGLPVSNADAQNSSGFVASLGLDFPEGVDITQDGHYAIFGDSSIATKVEVSDISSGKLAPTVLYTVPGIGHAVGRGVNSASVRLSPDQTMIFLGNNDGGSVSAAFFNAQTGVVRGGCTSPSLQGFYNPWAFTGSVVTRDTTGTGGVLYVAEHGSPSSFIGILNIASDGTHCTLSEAPASEVPVQLSDGLLSITVYPPRSF
jgi:hypothetical protein